MLKTEFYRKREDGVDLYMTYSDSNRYIIQNETNVMYETAIDIKDKYTYRESEEIIKEEINNE